jgi:hypothetical protein
LSLWNFSLRLNIFHFIIISLFVFRFSLQFIFLNTLLGICTILLSFRLNTASIVFRPCFLRCMSWHTYMLQNYVSIHTSTPQTEQIYKEKKHHCSSKFRHQCVKMSFASDNVFLLTSSALQFTGPSCFAQVKSCYNNHVTGNSDLMVMISPGHCVSNGLPLL